MLDLGGRREKKIITDAASFFTGKGNSSNKMHESVYEHLLASEYGWKLEYIRNLSMKDFTAHVLICTTKQRIRISQNEMMMSVGVTKGMI